MDPHKLNPADLDVTTFTPDDDPSFTFSNPMECTGCVSGCGIMGPVFTD
jgi:hypothetical protein